MKSNPQSVNLNNSNLIWESRNCFLVNWKNQYPQSSGEGICGRIIFKNDLVYLERNGELIKKLIGFGASKFKDLEKDQLIPSKVLISGDWIECFGINSIDELKVVAIHLLSPNLRGFGRSSEVKLAVRKWAIFVNQVRQYFISMKFDEINTPTLVKCPGTEPFLDPFKTEFKLGSRIEAFFLPTSPEIHLKKCLAKGWDRIFEIRPCFRNGEVSQTHQPEFFMLEWYRAFSSMNEIQRDIQNLVKMLSPNLKTEEWVSKSVAELFQEYLNFKLTPTTTDSDLFELAKNLNIDVSKSDDFDDLFFILFLEHIEPHLKEYKGLFLHSYPPSQAALARLTPEGWGDRFEFYLEGLEIANAFNELNNPEIQRSRTLEDLKKKKELGKIAIPIDEDFFEHLNCGMPPSCGIALGLDRLFMVLNNYKDIREFRLFTI